MGEHRFGVDSAGRNRRLCDAPITPAHAGSWGLSKREPLCMNYASRILEDGAGRCNTHADDRKASWVMCSQPTAWDPDAEVSTVTRTCGNRGRFVYEGRWHCKQHDPLRPRCEIATAHPWRNPVLGAVPIGTVQDPRTPTAVRKIGSVRVCAACLENAKSGLRPAREARPPCCLCAGSGALEDDAGRFFPCLCTPGGRQLANGGLNDATVAAALAADTTVAFVLEGRARMRGT